MRSRNTTMQLTTKKERPIIFNGIPIVGRMPLFRTDMRQAIRDDRKGQTRRVINNLLGFAAITDFVQSDSAGYDWCFRDHRALWNDITTARLMAACPYGKLGDVRCMTEPLVRGDNGFAYYKDDGALVVSLITGGPILWEWSKPWLSSIHMPTEAARTIRQYEDIRVERVQEISGADAKAEGCKSALMGDNTSWRSSYRQNFQVLWNSLNAKRGYGWDQNPWCWCITFKRLDES